MKKKEIKLVFEDNGEDVKVCELADFLFLFQAIYRLGSELTRKEQESANRGYADAVKIVKRKIHFEGENLNRFFIEDVTPKRLIPICVSQKSPIEIYFRGISILLAIAVIISGGEFEVSPTRIRAKLPPIGEGIKKLRDVFTSETKMPIGYSVGVRKIIFSKEEYNEIMRQDPETRNRGGFQGFLIGLQCRTKKKDRSIELSPSDVDKILKRGSNPKKGGWQSRIRKIFGGHFSFQ